jgi:aspartate aminotransferase
MPVAKKIAEAAQHSSWIRKMFEEGARLAATYGKDKVFDFSIGNPNLEPPEQFRQIMKELVSDPTPGLHGYMPNAGYEFARAAVAAFLSEGQGVPITSEHVVIRQAPEPR